MGLWNRRRRLCLPVLRSWVLLLLLRLFSKEGVILLELLLLFGLLLRLELLLLFGLFVCLFKLLLLVWLLLLFGLLLSFAAKAQEGEETTACWIHFLWR